MDSGKRWNFTVQSLSKKYTGGEMVPISPQTTFYRLTKNKKNATYYYNKIKPVNGILCSEVLPGFQFR